MESLWFVNSNPPLGVMFHAPVRTCRIQRGCRRKSYSGNLNLSANYRNALNSAEAV